MRRGQVLVREQRQQQQQPASPSKHLRRVGLLSVVTSIGMSSSSSVPPSPSAPSPSRPSLSVASSGPSASAAFKLLILATLTLQNSGITLVTRYSRGVLHEQYAVISTVILSEMIKLSFSVFMLLYANDWSLPLTAGRVWLDLRSGLVMSVPGLIYLIQNKLTYVGLQHLESASYSMLSQLKLLTTACFAVLILRKRLMAFQWRALVLLFIGVVLIQVQAARSQQQQLQLGVPRPSGDVWTGSLAVLGVATLSGLAGVYFEFVLKGSTAFSMWDRNVQLSMWGIAFGLLSIPLSAAELSFFASNSFFAGYSAWTVLVVLLASLGGLLVSSAVAYTDNIMKNFAASAAILLTSLISYLMFNDLQPDAVFLSGTGCVLLAIFNYNEDIKALSRSLGMVEVGDTVQGGGVVKIVAKPESNWQAGGGKERKTPQLLPQDEDSSSEQPEEELDEEEAVKVKLLEGGGAAANSKANSSKAQQ